MPNYTLEQKQDINERVNKANAFIKEQELALDILSYKVFLQLDTDGSPLFAEKMKVVLQDTKYANIKTDQNITETEDTDGKEADKK